MIVVHLLVYDRDDSSVKIIIIINLERNKAQSRVQFYFGLNYLKMN